MYLDPTKIVKFPVLCLKCVLLSFFLYTVGAQGLLAKGSIIC